MGIIQEIKFDNNYKKLQGAKFARLVAVFNGMSGELLRLKFPDLVMYDTARDDGRYYAINKNETYMLLLFLNESGTLFTSLRKQNPENAAKYNDSIGELFRLTVEA